jgi:hypothetical protein
MKKILLLAILSFGLNACMPMPTKQKYFPIKEVQKCNSGNAYACYEAGTIFEFGLFGAEKKHFSALIYYDKGCDLKNVSSCTSLAFLYHPSTKKDITQEQKKRQSHYKELEYTIKGCNLNDGFSCSYVGLMYKKGKGIKQNIPKAIEYYQKGCNLNDGFGCTGIGTIYREGNGVKQSDTQALEYYYKACDLKNQLGCRNYAQLKKK